MDSLFQSFNQQVSMHNFAELSGCVFSWIEEQCKPGDLQVIKEIGEFFCSQCCLARTWSTQYCDRQGTVKGNEVGAQMILLTSLPDSRIVACYHLTRDWITLRDGNYPYQKQERADISQSHYRIKNAFPTIKEH